MDNLIGLKVMNRKSHRRGTIVQLTETRVCVEYDAGIEKYPYPGAFADTLVLENGDVQAQILNTGRESSFQSFRTAYVMALSKEIMFLRKTGGKHYRGMDGRMLRGGKGQNYLYIFDTDSELHFPDGSEIRILTVTVPVKRGNETVNVVQEVYDYATVASCDEFSITISYSESLVKDLKQMIENIEFTAAPWQLMQGLADRLEEINPASSQIAYMVACQSDLQIDRMSGIMLGQNQALRCSTSQPVTFIWGPPGTGKTETLARIALEFMNKRKRVLMLSYSNVSVDGAILRVAKKAAVKPGQIIRYGYPRNEELMSEDKQDLLSYMYVIRKNKDEYQHYQELIEKRKKRKRDDPERDRLNRDIVRFRKRFHDAESELVHKALFVATTVSKATVDSAIYGQKFDAVLFDEASMANVSQVVIAASLAKESFCCLGDFRQLPAIVTDDGNVTLQKDIFEYCGIEKAVENNWSHKWLVMLDTQYRMHPEIADFISKMMYQGLIRSGEGTLEHCQSIADYAPFAGEAMGLVDLSGTYSVCVRTMDQSRINLMSALVSLRLAELFCSRGGYQVGIITPYSAQARLLLQMVRDLKERDERYGKITCATVHQFQGSEQTVIIYDAVDCFRAPYPGMLLTSKKNRTADRLFNVAMTRAQGKFIMVANVDYFRRKKIAKDLLFTRTLRMMKHRGNVISGENLISALSSGFSDREYVYCGGMDEQDSWDRYMRDIESAKESIYINLPDEIDADDDEAVDSLVEAIRDRAKSKVRITIRKGEDIDCLPQLRKLMQTDAYVATPFTVIDQKIIWFGEPLFYGDFISMGEPIPTQTFPCLRFEGKHTARLMKAIYEMTRTVKNWEDEDEGTAESEESDG